MTDIIISAVLYACYYPRSYSTGQLLSPLTTLTNLITIMIFVFINILINCMQGVNIYLGLMPNSLKSFVLIVYTLKTCTYRLNKL